MSNGGLCSSARPAVKNTRPPTTCQASHHGCHASTMPLNDSVPAAIATDAAASTNGSSYDISWAATRIPPSRLNLFALAQPPIRVPTTPTPITASAKNSPTSRSSPTRPGPSGITSRTTRYGSSATAGASLKTVRSAAVGTTSSFCTNFTPSAMSCAQPWKPPAYIGPTRDCMCAIALCSTCPTNSGSTRNAASTRTSRSTTSSTSAIAVLPGWGLPVGHRPGGAPAPWGRSLGTWPGTRSASGADRRTGGSDRERVGGRRPRCTRTPLLGLGSTGWPGPSTRGHRLVALATFPWLLGAGPRLGHAGGEHEVLAQRVALEAVGQQERRQRQHSTTGSEVDAEHLVGLPLVPPGAGEDVGDRLEHWGVARHQRAQHKMVDGSRAVVGQVAHDPEPVGQLVDGGKPVEEGAAEPVTRGRDGLDPPRGRHVHRDRPAPLVHAGLVIEQIDVHRTHRVRPRLRGTRHVTASGGGVTRPRVTEAASWDRYRVTSDSPSIFSRSLRMPWSSASGRGGQPGT